MCSPSVTHRNHTHTGHSCADEVASTHCHPLSPPKKDLAAQKALAMVTALTAVFVIAEFTGL
jgi:hypothetical protein